MSIRSGTDTAASNRNVRPTAVVALLLVALLSGCATFYSEDGGFDTVASAASEHLGKEARWLKDEANAAEAYTEVSKLLSRPLSVDDAVQIALLNNPGLQAAYSELGISEADRVQAGRLPNPGFSFSNTSGGGALEIERMLSFSVGAILTLPLRVSMENRRFEAAKLAAAAATLDVAFSAREAYFQAVATQQMTSYMRQVLDAAEASRDSMNRMARVGTSSKLELAREQLFHADAVTGLARATQRAVEAREALIRVLGLFGNQLGFVIAERLPELPETPLEISNIEQTALKQRLDVQMARLELESLKRSMNLTSTNYFVSLLEEAGPLQVRDKGEPIRNGYEIVVEIPIFDLGDARVARAKALYMRGVHQLRETAVAARSQVRERYQGYRSAYDIAAHYRDKIVPLRTRISDEQLLRYNGMLTGVFELIQDAREQVVSVTEAMQAARDFWLADTSLKRVTLGAGSPNPSMTEDLPSAPAGQAAAH